MLDVDPNIYILAHSYDLIVSAAYLAFLLTIAPKIFRKFLVPFGANGVEQSDLDTNGSDPYWGIFKREHFYPLLKVLVLLFLFVSVELRCLSAFRKSSKLYLLSWLSLHLSCNWFLCSSSF